jgi:hypothetical protein
VAEVDEPADDVLVDKLQRAAFGYFQQEMNPANGLVPDTSRENSPVSIAVVGFTLSAYPVGVERGWMTRAEAVARSLAVLRFFHASDQSGSPEATGYKGFYYHFLDLHTGARVWDSELSMIDTALLIIGALTAAQYFRADTADEIELCALADALYRRMEWSWAQNAGPTLSHGWKPDSGFLHYGWEGYSEAIVLYVLALGSPTHPLEGDCYAAWTTTYQWENLYGYAWIDFRGIRDRFMREKRCDYFENSRRATEVQREYALRNPHGFAGYDQDSWGLTACDGPGRSVPLRTNERRSFLGYAARGAPYGPDDGTLAGWAAVASLPFAPDIALRAARAMARRYPEMLTAERYASSFNPTLADTDQRPWVSAGNFGLDQGIVVLMIENYRTQLIWRLMRDCPYVRLGLRRAGFRRGWL